MMSDTSDSISKEAYRKVIEELRAGRRAAAELSAIKRASKGKRKKAVKDPDAQATLPPSN